PRQRDLGATLGADPPRASRPRRRGARGRVRQPARLASRERPQARPEVPAGRAAATHGGRGARSAAAPRIPAREVRRDLRPVASTAEHHSPRRTLPRMAGVENGAFSIAHISDLHCGGPHFVPTLLERAISEINELKPDLVVCSGDLTTFGFKPEYVQAKSFLDKIECESFVIVPGNHDARNVGGVLGKRSSVLHVRDGSVAAVDSTEPDLDHGEIGRGRYPWIEEQFSRPAALRIFVLHHHLLPVPGTGRERNVVYDAGDAIE